MDLKQHVDLITFTMIIQRETLTSAIPGDSCVYASMYVPLYVSIIYTEIQTHTLHSHTNTTCYKRKISQ